MPVVPFGVVWVDSHALFSSASRDTARVSVSLPGSDAAFLGGNRLTRQPASRETNSAKSACETKKQRSQPRVGEEPRNTRQGRADPSREGRAGQIASGAERLNLPFSSFVRHAALQASAVVEKKVEVKPRPAARREVPAPVLEEPEPHFVDGELVVVPHYTGTPEAA